MSPGDERRDSSQTSRRVMLAFRTELGRDMDSLFALSKSARLGDLKKGAESLRGGRKGNHARLLLTFIGSLVAIRLQNIGGALLYLGTSRVLLCAVLISLTLSIKWLYCDSRFLIESN